MDNDKNDNSQNKKDQTLSLEDVSISTMKEELAKVDEKDNKGGWFDFISKHKEDLPKEEKKEAVPAEEKPAKEEAKEEKIDLPDQETEEIVSQSKVLMGEDTNQPSEPELSGEMNDLSRVLAPKKEEKEEGAVPKEESLLEKELDSFQAEISKNQKMVETPDNLPVAEESVSKPNLSDFLPKNEEKKEVEVEIPKTTPNKLSEVLNQEKPVLEMKSDSISFAQESEKKEEKSSEATPEKTSEETLGLKKFSLNDEAKEEKQDKSEGMINTLHPVGGEGLSGMVDGKPENPFSAHLDPRERDGSSLLQKVESAINYSASPDFSKERDLSEKILETGGVLKGEEKPKEGVPAEKKTSDESDKKKKMMIIGGGVGGVVLVFVVLILIFAGSGSKTSETNENLNANKPISNLNVNKNPIVNANTSVPTDETPKIAIQKVIENTESLVVESPADIQKKMGEYKNASPVNKLTQIVLAKSTGSAISLKELADSLKLNIPLKIIPNPESLPALVFVDYFDKNNVFGLILPTNSRDETLFLKMSDWEATMVNDLEALWNGMEIDNKAGYFSDSKLFSNARYALIDKKSGLTLDYVVTGGNVFVTFGKYSMQALNKEFMGIQKNTGIKWENSTETPSASSSSQTSSSQQTETASNSNENTGLTSPNSNANSN